MIADEFIWYRDFSVLTLKYNSSVLLQIKTSWKGYKKVRVTDNMLNVVPR